jgi:hypothetical protein
MRDACGMHFRTRHRAPTTSSNKVWLSSCRQFDCNWPTVGLVTFNDVAAVHSDSVTQVAALLTFIEAAGGQPDPAQVLPWPWLCVTAADVKLSFRLHTEQMQSSSYSWIRDPVKCVDSLRIINISDARETLMKRHHHGNSVMLMVLPFSWMQWMIAGWKFKTRDAANDDRIL